ncbi:MAG: hypothetical protein AB1393_05360 [Candidatus Edwardsbacteria bacterium]
MRPKRYIVWSKNEIDLQNPFERRWYIKQVLTYGRAEDIASLDWDEVKTFLSELELPEDIKNLWENYLDAV